MGSFAFTACIIADDDGDTDAGTSSPTTTAAPTTTADDDGGTASAGATTDGGDTTAGPGDTTAGPGDTTAGDPTAGDTTAGDTGVTGDPLEACLAACDQGAKCKGVENTDCPDICAEDVGLVTKDGCEQEYIAQQTCAGALDCKDYLNWLDEVGDPYPCQAEDEALSVCVDGAGGTTTGG